MTEKQSGTNQPYVEASQSEKPQEPRSRWTRLDSNQRPTQDDFGLGKPLEAQQGDAGRLPSSLEPVGPSTAAPELYEALDRLLTFAEELCEDINVSKHYPSIDNARAVLAKASGRPSLEPSAQPNVAPTYRGSDWPPSPSLEVTLEDRVAVALSGRGDQRIGQFIENSLTGRFYMDFYFLSDEAFVRALEAAVQGDAEGVHLASLDGVSGASAPLHRDGERAE